MLQQKQAGLPATVKTFPPPREPVAEFMELADAIAALRSTHGGSSNHSVEGPHNNNHCERSDKPITHCYFLWRRNQASAGRTP